MLSGVVGIGECLISMRIVVRNILVWPHGRMFMPMLFVEIGAPDLCFDLRQPVAPGRVVEMLRHGQ